MILIVLFFASLAHAEPISVRNNEIIFEKNAFALKHIEIGTVQSAKMDNRVHLEMGQIIALSNPTGELSQSRTSWVELDPMLSRSMGLNLNRDTRFPVRTAIGLSVVSAEYSPQIKSGQPIRIRRYRLQNSGTSGSVLWTRPANQPDLLQVVFEIQRGEEWLPGTNCEVEFPLVKSDPVRIPSTSLLHIETEEFTLKEINPGEFIPKHVTVLEENSNDIVVTGGIIPGDKIITRGAILLKPLVQKILSAVGEFNHAP